MINTAQPIPSTGMLITAEGLDFTGKTTQVALLQEALSKFVSLPVYKFREPGGNKISEDIRTILKKGGALAPVAELMLFCAARNQLVEETIKPLLARGHIVICDRFIDSTIAYQHYGNQLDGQMVLNMIDYAVGKLRPDVTIWLDIPHSVRKIRAKIARNGAAATDAYDTADDEKVEQIYNGFEACAALNPCRIVKVDATGTEAEVHQRVLSAVKSRIPVSILAM